jgi:dihydroxy-acid dehydratase
MTDLDRIGGVPVVMKELLDAGLLHGDALTVTGRTIGRGARGDGRPRPDGEVVHPLTARSTPTAGSRSCAARSRPTARSSRSPGIPPEQHEFEGPARVFDGEQGAMEAVLTGRSSTATSS